MDAGPSPIPKGMQRKMGESKRLVKESYRGPTGNSKGNLRANQRECVETCRGIRESKGNPQGFQGEINWISNLSLKGIYRERREKFNGMYRRNIEFQVSLKGIWRERVGIPKGTSRDLTGSSKGKT